MKRWFISLSIATICFLILDNSLKVEVAEEEIPGMSEISEVDDLT